MERVVVEDPLSRGGHTHTQTLNTQLFREGMGHSVICRNQKYTAFQGPPDPAVPSDRMAPISPERLQLSGFFSADSSQ